MENLRTDMSNGFIRVAAASPDVKVADVDANVEAICGLISELDDKGVEVAVFPELCVTGYTCGDLFHNATLLKSASEALVKIQRFLENRCISVIVGYPRVDANKLYNSAAFIDKSRIITVDKTYIPSYGEFYEKRWFEPADINMAASNLIELTNGTIIGLEICEDLWAPIAPSAYMTLSGAQVVFNLSASNDVIYKYDYLRKLVLAQSQKCACGYVYASSGFGESTTDVVFLPKQMIAECGEMLAENDRYDLLNKCKYVISDIDLDLIDAVRIKDTTIADCARNSNLESLGGRVNDRFVYSHECACLCRDVNPLPFVPSGLDADMHLDEILNMQCAGLLKRLSVLPTHNVVIGISGGLDSTLALMVSVYAYRLCGFPLKDITAVTMPGFGTSGRTYRNALELMKQLGVTVREISIKDAVCQHFNDIGHDINQIDVTYENSQARERTQILMDIANQVNGIVLGTGDLSELALGWCTYNGDHMSMYGINAGVPKTLVKALVARVAVKYKAENEIVSQILFDIVDTPISPELKPTDEHGDIAQITENSVGPYELHDFFIYYWLKYGFSLPKIFYLATIAFEDKYDRITILRWLRVFVCRFFTQQFKRSCLPDGPKVTEVSLSPRGDWRMPSDASYKLWLKSLDEIENELL